jgi:hypothetical protein
VSSDLQANYERLCAALPAPGEGLEIVLRDEKGEATALQRQAGHPPRVFAWRADRLVELHATEDQKIPAAYLIGDQAALAAALPAELARFVACDLVAWRPRRRAVLRLTLPEAEPVYLKFLDKKMWSRAENALSGLRAAPGPLQLALPWLMLPELCGYAARSASGESLHGLLSAGRGPDWHLVDEAIASLARAWVPEGLPRHDFAAARHSAVTMLQRAGSVAPRCAAIAEQVAEVAPPSTAQEGCVHGDFHDKQLFVTATSAWLIDLEGVGTGDPNFDLVNLSEQLRLRSLQHSDEDDGSGAELLARHAERSGLGPADLRRWQTVVRARLVGVYAMRPRWQTVVDRLFAEVEDLIGSLT